LGGRKKAQGRSLSIVRERKKFENLNFHKKTSQGIEKRGGGEEESKQRKGLFKRSANVGVNKKERVI